MKKFLKRNLEFFIVFGLISLFAVFYLWDSIIVTVYPGHTGVKFRRFFNKGTVIEKSFKEGVHFLLPWNKMYVYDVRIQKLKQEVEVLSQNGLTIKVVVSVRYYLLKNEVPLLHQKVGEDYRDKVIIPSTISSVREVIGKYLPEQLYTTARHVIQDEILVGTIEETGRLPIIYSDMIIELIKLPDMINLAIETKLKHQQEYLEYQYKLLKTTAEKERLIIEATGIREYQQIIAQSLSEPLLKWQGIQATKEIATSTNSKIIVIGGKDGLPIILNTEGSPGRVQTPDAPVPPKEPSPLQEAPLVPEPKKEPTFDPNGENLSESVPQDQEYTDAKKIWDAMETFNKRLSQNPFVDRNPDGDIKQKE
ncbi:MAG: prohibitin family protein [Proteobacteria bacterium]|nr:prohibitin family protein [Pseudomonadota bacterium]